MNQTAPYTRLGPNSEVVIEREETRESCAFVWTDRSLCSASRDLDLPYSNGARISNSEDSVTLGVPRSRSRVIGVRCQGVCGIPSSWENRGCTENRNNCNIEIINSSSISIRSGRYVITSRNNNDRTNDTTIPSRYIEDTTAKIACDKSDSVVLKTCATSKSDNTNHKLHHFPHPQSGNLKCARNCFKDFSGSSTSYIRDLEKAEKHSGRLFENPSHRQELKSPQIIGNSQKFEKPASSIESTHISISCCSSSTLLSSSSSSSLEKTRNCRLKSSPFDSADGPSEVSSQGREPAMPPGSLTRFADLSEWLNTPDLKLRQQKLESSVQKDVVTRVAMDHKCSTKNRKSLSWSRNTATFSLSQIGLLLAFLLSVFVSFSEAANGHTITAFEYQRKFNKPLDLGECPQRKVVVRTGNNRIVVESQRCTLHQQGTVQHMPRELNDSRNVIITSPYGIVHYLGLCGGEAASFLGILVSGDCVAVEIASRLTFNEKTLIRAFVGLYRKSLDVLDSESNITNGMVRYYKDKFYLKNRSYGTIDLIIVQFRFKNARMKEEARDVNLQSSSMSEYMRAIEDRVGKPRGVTVINLSTATSSSYEIARFRFEDWDRALRHVQVAEMDIRNLRQDITNNNLRPQPHLKYQLFPFVDTEQWSPRHTKPLSWEKISMLEVKLRHAIVVAKKTARKCRGNKSNLCRRVRGLRRELNTTYVKIHDVRSKWVDLSKEDKTEFATRHATAVTALSSVTKKLTQKVRQQRRKAKMQTLNKKRSRKNSRNQIPNPVVKIEGRTRKHSIRHSRRKNRSRSRKNRV